ncbi:MAG: peptidoglycan editing factor PgeF [Chloroflexota bacterium]|nr:peptidoglycan editing factor PgeF [Dehalococcoidia bacterium]MDW8255163.1 peptidoglycan editing factor PgeF [Chloroflexota bacterium]
MSGRDAATAMPSPQPLAALRFSVLEAHGVRHAATLRTRGASRPPYHYGNLGFAVPDDPQAVVANREAAAAAAGVTLDALVVGQQVHGDRIAAVGPADRGRGARGRDALPATDALITDSPEVALLVLTADCAALVLYAPDVRALGVAHLGWRGTVARLAEKMVDALAQRYGADPRRLVGALAPSIGPCCYGVGEEVIDAVRSRFRSPDALLIRRAAGVAFDIPGAILQQLADAGVAPAAIERSPLCTSCRTDLFYSHRAERGRTGRTGLIAALPAV